MQPIQYHLVCSTALSYGKETALVSMESSPAHAAREQKARFPLIKQRFRVESLQRQWQDVLLEQLAANAPHSLSRQADQVARRIGHLHLRGLMPGL